MSRWFAQALAESTSQGALMDTQMTQAVDDAIRAALMDTQVSQVLEDAIAQARAVE